MDEDAVLELRAGSDQRDEVGEIDGTPAVLCRLDERAVAWPPNRFTGGDQGVTNAGGPTLGYNASLTTNFALFAREIVGLARDGDPWRGEPAWPPAYVQGKIEEPLRGQARTEWLQWWAELVQGARTLHHSGDAMKVSDVMDPPNFRLISNRQALQQVCQVAWPHFLGWWGPGGGSAFVFRAKTYLRDWWEAMPKDGIWHLTLDFQYVSGKTYEVVAGDYVMFGSGWLGNPSDVKAWLSQNVRK